MSGPARGFLRVTAALVALALVGYAGWRWGDDAVTAVTDRTASVPEAREEATPELAEEARKAIDALRRDPDAVEISLTAVELESLVRYSAPGVLPEGVIPPRVAFRSGEIHLEGRVAVDAFPPVPEVERIVGVLPDTVSVQVVGSVLPYEEGWAVLRVQRIRVAGIPLPRRLTPRVLEILGRRERQGLPPDAMDVPLPAGLSSAYILTDSLVLVAAEERE